MADIKKLVEEIKSMSVLEVSELVKELEERDNQKILENMIRLS